MGMFDKMKKKATEAVEKHGDKVGEGIDKAAGMADQRTGGKHSDRIHAGAAKAKDALDSLDRRNDDIPDPDPATDPTASTATGPGSRPDSPPGQSSAAPGGGEYGDQTGGSGAPGDAEFGRRTDPSDPLTGSDSTQHMGSTGSTRPDENEPRQSER